MNEEIMRKLEAMQVINKQLHDKLEQARIAASFYREKINAESGNLDSVSNKLDDMACHNRVFTVDFLGDVSQIHDALGMLQVYDGIQLIVSDEDKADTIVKIMSYLRYGRFPNSVFSTRRNSKGIIVWRID
jgi:hypothetical protein